MKDTFIILREKFEFDKNLYNDILNNEDNYFDEKIRLEAKIEYIDRILKFLDELIFYIK